MFSNDFLLRNLILFDEHTFFLFLALIYLVITFLLAHFILAHLFLDKFAFLLTHSLTYDLSTIKLFTYSFSHFLPIDLLKYALIKLFTEIVFYQ